jgi:FkbM family methyltransferase
VHVNIFCFRDNTQDPFVIQEVLDENSYGVPQFKGHEVVIDLGANIGCFAARCLENGAGHVECYEIERGNCAILRRNMQYYGSRVKCHQKAAWRSDDSGPQKVLKINHRGDYTAMHTCFGDGDPVTTVGLDDLLDQFSVVDLLKLDIEGCEFPVLYTSQLLNQSRVKRIVGEIHPAFRFEGEGWDCTAQGVVNFLNERGYDVTLKEVRSADPNKSQEFDAVPKVGEVTEEMLSTDWMECV